MPIFVLCATNFREDPQPSLGKKKSQRQNGMYRQHSVYVKIDVNDHEKESNAADRG